METRFKEKVLKKRKETCNKKDKFREGKTQQQKERWRNIRKAIVTTNEKKDRKGEMKRNRKQMYKL